MTGDLTNFIQLLQPEALEKSLNHIETTWELFRWEEQDNDHGQTRLVRVPNTDKWTAEVRLIWDLLHTAIDARNAAKTQMTLFDMSSLKVVEPTPMDRLFSQEAAV